MIPVTLVKIEDCIVSDIKTDVVRKNESISESEEMLIEMPKVKEIQKTNKSSKRFYSPLIKSIVKKEGITLCINIDYIWMDNKKIIAGK